MTKATETIETDSLADAVFAADPHVWQAIETLDQYADDEPDGPTATLVRDDADRLRQHWRTILTVRAHLLRQGDVS